MLMLGSKRLHRNTQFHSRITVGTYKLVMIQLDDVALGIGYCCRNSHQFARLIRKQYGYGEDPVSLDQAMLNDGRHGNHIHVAAA